jgi:HEAT repeat protein
MTPNRVVSNLMAMVSHPLPTIRVDSEPAFHRVVFWGVSLSLDPEAAARVSAILELGELKAAAAPAIPCLIRRLHEDRLRTASASDRGLLPQPQSDRLRTRIAQADRACMEAAAIALANIGSPAVPSLTRACQSRVPNIRVGAIRALGMMGPAARLATADLKTIARGDPSKSIRSAASHALTRTTAEPESGKGDR